MPYFMISQNGPAVTLHQQGHGLLQFVPVARDISGTEDVIHPLSRENRQGLPQRRGGGMNITDQTDSGRHFNTRVKIQP